MFPPIETKKIGQFEGFEITAEVWHDDSISNPSQEFDCYTQEQVEAWRSGAWFFVGLVVHASFKGHELGHSSLWGIEYGYLPGVDGPLDPLEDEDYLPDLIIDAVTEAKHELAKLVDSAVAALAEV